VRNCPSRFPHNAKPNTCFTGELDEINKKFDKKAQKYTLCHIDFFLPSVIEYARIQGKRLPYPHPIRQGWIKK